MPFPPLKQVLQERSFFFPHLLFFFPHLLGAAVLSVAAQLSGVGLGPLGASVLACAGAKVLVWLEPRARAEAVPGQWAVAELGLGPDA